MKTATAVLSAVVLGALRAAGHKSIAFQAIAHVFVGGAFGVWLGGRWQPALWIAVALTVLEVLCFVGDRFHVLP